MVVPSFEVTVLMSFSCAIALVDVGYLLDSSRDGLVSAATWIHPRTAEGGAVGAKHAPVIGWGTFLAAPDRQRIALQFVYIVEGFAHTTVVARFDVRAWLFSKQP